MEIRLSGFGGQGIIRMGLILGRAVSIFDNRNATLTQSFGPEARGGACSAQLVVSDQPVLYPYLTRPEILVAMSQEAYDKFEPELAPDGILLIEEELVRAHPPRDQIRQYGIAATRLGEQLGNRMYANMVMLGFMNAIARIVPQEALRRALDGMVPSRLLPQNLAALEKGYEIGLAKITPGR